MRIRIILLLFLLAFKARLIAELMDIGVPGVLQRISQGPGYFILLGRIPGFTHAYKENGRYRVSGCVSGSSSAHLL